MRVLILGGTAEANRLARTITDAEVTLSLAGLAPPPDLPCRIRVGGFGGADGLAAWLQDQGIDRVLDATHPFAARIAANAALACERSGVPRLKLLRPAWTAVEGDRWIPASSIDDAVQRLPFLGRRIWLAVGTRGGQAFAGVPVAFAPPFDLLVSRNSGGEAGHAKIARARGLGIPVLMIDRPPPPIGPCVPDVSSALAWLCGAATSACDPAHTAGNR